jgi:hypothetical protein
VLAALTVLYAIPVWLLLALAIVVAAGLACGGQLVVRRLFPGAISAVIIIGLCYLVGFPDVRTQLLMTGALAAMIAVMFTLIFELDYPFRGDLAIPPVDWQAFYDENKGGI